RASSSSLWSGWDRLTPSRRATRRSAGLRASQRVDELATGSDTDLLEDLAEGIRDRVRADVEVRRDPPVGVARGGGVGDWEFLGREAAPSLIDSSPCVLTAGLELGLRAPSKGGCAHGHEGVAGRY